MLPTVPEKEWLRGRCRLAPGRGGGGNESPWRPPVLLKKRGLARAILHNLAIASSMGPSFSLGSSKARVAVGNEMVLSKYAREQRHYGVLTVTSFT